MQITGDYQADGYAFVEEFIPREVANALVQQLELDLKAAGQSFDKFAQKLDLMNKPTVEISGHHYRPLLTFLWGLTPIVSKLTGRDLLPSYDYFRIYSAGDILRVHSDRPSCEHSASLTLFYSDGKPWPLDMGTERIEGPDYLKDAFGDEPHTSLSMMPGDAVIYQGVNHRHGRGTPNPNKWSAHLFLHWVDRDGPHAEHAFDAKQLAAVAAGTA